MSFFDPQNPGIGGLDELTDSETLVVQQIAGLGGPNADRILFWDDSLGSYRHLIVGSGLTIIDDTITASGGGTIDGSGVANEIPYWVDSNTLGSLAVASYPHLPELSRIKGLTSAVQTQLDARIPTSYLDTDTTLSANSDAKVATQKAVKAYVDASVTGLLDLKGSTDCSANPNYPAASKGDSYYVTVAGRIGGASGKVVEIGDVYVALLDNAGGTEASVGTSWFVLNQNLSGVALTSGTLGQFATSTVIAIGVGSIELGHASDTTISRVSAGVIAVEGVTVPTISSTNTLTNKTLTSSTNVLGGVTMTLGSDADGDTYYRSSSVLTRVPKGTAGQVYTMNAGATAPEWQTPAGGGNPGWDFVSYNTATNSASITVSSLDLATDLCYRIVFQMVADSGTNSEVSMTVGGTGLGTYVYGFQYVSQNGATNAVGNGGSNGAGKWVLNGEDNNSYSGDYILSLGSTNGTQNLAMMHGTTGTFGSTFVTNAHFGGTLEITTLTSIILTATAGTPNWRVWVFKAATS